MALDAYGFCCCQPTSQLLTKVVAFICIAMMLIGGVSVLLGMVTASGSALLILFTLLGYVQHPQRS
jgi:uncharacterized membrane protein YphA (DoxX/SURF4 family)